MTTTESWKQFSLYPPGCRNLVQPRQVLLTFLPRWLERVRPLTKWHVLFEPSALVRFNSRFPDFALREAEELAAECGLVLERGDCSSSINPNLMFPGEDYGGESEVYGEDLWSALAGYLQACSELSLAVHTLRNERQLETTSRAVHLLLNSTGMNYLEEFTLCWLHAERAKELVTKFYRT